ncbi:hypothetical protein JCM10213_005457 [Rhodosporidiobolus nylandii]
MATPSATAGEPAPLMAHRRNNVAKPPVGRYDLRALLKAPGRLLHPGEAIAKELEQQSPRAGDKGAPGDRFAGYTAGKVRGVSRVKLCDVGLEDVIEGQYTPPLTLRDFEDYLAFREKSAENLYFFLWLREYSRLFIAHPSSSRPHQDVITLGTSFKTAVEVFFSASSPLELNVPSDVRREIDGHIRAVAQPSAAQPSNDAFLPPAAFDKVGHITSESLAVSFKGYKKQVTRNADRNRGWFAMFLGAFTWLLGCIPAIVCGSLGLSRGWRAFGIPLWWFGPLVFLGGFGKTCLVIYLFGDSRQLYPWELARETEASTVSSFTDSSRWGPTSDLERDAHSFTTEKQTPPQTPLGIAPPRTHTVTLPGQDASPSARSSSPGGSSPSGFAPHHSPFSDLGYFPLQPGSPTTSNKASSKNDSRRPSASTATGLYFAPAGMDLPKSSPTWAPFTKMLSPIIAREQRDLVVRSAGYSLVICALSCVVCIAPPNIG